MPAIKRGFSSMGRFDTEEHFDRAHTAGFDFVEVGLQYYDRSSLWENTDELRSLAVANDLELIAHLPFGGESFLLASIDEQLRTDAIDNYRAWLQLAGRLDARKAVLHLDSGDTPHLLEQGRMDILADVVETLDAGASDHDVELCVENMSSGPPRPEDLIELAATTDVSLTYDTGHGRLNDHSDEEMVSYVREHAPAISHFHLNETREGRGDEHLPIGAGTIDFPGIVQALPDDWSGTMTMEIDTTDFEYITFSLEKLDAIL